MTRGDLSHRQSVHASARHSTARVKMGDWNFLGGILEEVHIHSTTVGKIWLTILFIFRMLVLGVAAEDVWNDEQSEFVCNTDQPGCHNVCYDRAFPVSLVRLWVLQVIFVSSPSLAYMGHALYRLRAMEKERKRKKGELRRELEDMTDWAEHGEEARRRLERELRLLEHRKSSKAPLRGALLHSYVAHIVTRSAVEVGFMLWQYLLYGFRLEPLYKCEREPCPNAVDCFVSRPTEKSFFMVFMQCIAGLSLFLNVLEIMHLAYRRMKTSILDDYPHLKEDLADSYALKPQVGVGTFAAEGHKSAVSSSYGLETEKQVDKPTSYPPLVISPPSAFSPVKGEGRVGGRDVLKDSREIPHSPAESKENSRKEPPPCRTKQEAEPEKGPANPPPYSKALEPGNLQLAGVGGRKIRRVSAPTNYATLVEGKADTGLGREAGSRSHPGIARTRPPSRSDPKRPARSHTPESVEESSSESRHSPRKLLPTRRTLLASSRWAATDLRI